jgi:glutathione S-transferase
MKIHFSPVSTASRPVILFCEQNNIPYDGVVVDLMTGEHKGPAFLKLNPNGLVPVLEDGDFLLSESSAILKYIADKHNSPAYPKDLKQRARVNELMDWFNTQFYRELGYHIVYPQTFPHHKRSPDAVNVATVEWGKKQLEAWAEVLDKHYIGSNKYVCGNEITIADYLGAEILSSGDLIGVNVKRYPNVDRWMNTMRSLPAWKKVHEVIDGFAASLKGQQFLTFQ